MTIKNLCLSSQFTYQHQLHLLQVAQHSFVSRFLPVTPHSSSQTRPAAPRPKSCSFLASSSEAQRLALRPLLRPTLVQSQGSSAPFFSEHSSELLAEHPRSKLQCCSICPRFIPFSMLWKWKRNVLRVFLRYWGGGCTVRYK